MTKNKTGIKQKTWKKSCNRQPNTRPPSLLQPVRSAAQQVQATPHHLFK
jgi:hypothetical protein